MCVFLFNKHVLSMLKRKFKNFAHMSEFIYTYSTISHTSLKNWTVWRRMIYRNCSSGIVFRSSSMLPLSRPTADHESIGTRPSPSFAGYWPIIWWRSSRTVQDPPLDLQGIDRLYDGALAAWYKTLSVHEYRYFLPVFRIWVIFRIRIELFFLCPDRDRPKIRIRSGKILIRIHEKNRYKTVSTSRQICISYLALSTLSFLVRLLQNLIKNII